VTAKKKDDDRREEQDKKEGFPESTIPFFFRQMERQMELWNDFAKSEEGMDAAQAGLDFAQISTKHMADIFSKIGETLPEDMSPDEVFQKSKEIYQICAESYSDMFKEAMATSSIPKQNAKLVDAFLNWKIETDRTNQDTLRNLGIPTQTDIDEIAEKLYWLDKKMDTIAKELRQANSASRRSKNR